MSSGQPLPITLVAGGAEAGVLAGRLAIDGVDALVVSESIADDQSCPGRLVTRPDLVSRTADCTCCQVRIDLVEAIERVVKRKWQPRRVVLGITADEAVAATYTVLSDPDLRRLVRLDGVVAAVDAVALVTRSRTGRPVVNAASATSLAICDRVVVARTDEVLGSALQDVCVDIARTARFATIVAPARAPVSGSELVELDAWHGVPSLAMDDLAPAGATAGPETVVLRQEGLLDADQVEAWLDDVISAHAPRLLRLQGALAVYGAVGRICCHGVRSYAMSHSAKDHKAERTERSLVALAGVGLDAVALAEGLGRTRVR